MMTEKFGEVHVRGVGNFVCAGTRDLRVGLIVLYALSRAPRRPQ